MDEYNCPTPADYDSLARQLFGRGWDELSLEQQDEVTSVMDDACYEEDDYEEEFDEEEYEED